MVHVAPMKEQWCWTLEVSRDQHHSRKSDLVPMFPMTHNGGMSQQRAEYVARINRVIDHIENHLDEELTLERLAEVALFSRYHFHRIFGAMVGETLGQFIQRLRVEKAATLLLANPKKSITTIALECGFSGSAAFARAFKTSYGVTASEWRNGSSLGDSKIRQVDRNRGQTGSNLGQESTRQSPYLGSDNETPRGFEMPAEKTLTFDVTVEDLPDRHVAYVRHVGPYRGNAQLFEELFGRLMRWAGPRGHCSPEAKVMSVYHDNPDITDEDKLRISACLTVPEGTPVDGEVGTMVVPGGRFAVAHFEITDTDQYAEAWKALMLNWLPDSGYQPDDRLCFEDLLNDPNEDPEGTHIFDICIPVKPLSF